MDARRTLLQMPGSCPWGSLQPGAERDRERIQREWGSGPQVASLFLCQTNSIVYKYIGSVSCKINDTIFLKRMQQLILQYSESLWRSTLVSYLAGNAYPPTDMYRHTQEPAFTYAACVCMDAPQWGSRNTRQLSQELPVFPCSEMNSFI